MKVNYVDPVRKSVFYNILECGDVFYDDDGGDLNIKVNDTLSIFLSDNEWHTISRCESETVYPVSATLNVEN